MRSAFGDASDGAEGASQVARQVIYDLGMKTDVALPHWTASDLVGSLKAYATALAPNRCWFSKASASALEFQGRPLRSVASAPPPLL